MKYKQLWAVTANGGRARIIKNMGSTTEKEQVIELERKHEKLGEIMSDRQGRTFSSAGAGRSAMELKSNPVRDREKQFACDVADFLSRKQQKGEISALVLAASPRMLGDLRGALPDALKKSIVRECDKDFTLLPINKLKVAFQNMLRQPETS